MRYVALDLEVAQLCFLKVFYIKVAQFLLVSLYTSPLKFYPADFMGRIIMPHSVTARIRHVDYDYTTWDPVSGGRPILVSNLSMTDLPQGPYIISP